MEKKSTYFSAVFGAALFLATAGAAMAQNQPIGILGLYSADDPQNVHIADAKLADLGCTIRHTGIIGAEQGDIDLEQPNQFVFLACADTLLQDTAKRAQLEGLTASGRAIAILEGQLTDFPDTDRDSAVTGRQYILKVSHYNNLDIKARDLDLASLTQEAALLPDSYVTESFIGVNHASGLATPDEVVLIFYDNAETGDRFRRNSKELLGKVGAFNRTHLIDTVYYIGQVSQ